MNNFKWSSSNQKLNKTAKAWEKRFGRKAKFVSFNIPRLRSEDGQVTCPYAGMCADICYADQGRLAMPMAKDARELNLDIMNSISWKDFVELVSEDLSKMRSVTHVRIHDSGDFYSRPHYKSWVDIARTNGDVVFYAYTKSIPFLKWDIHPKNFRVVQSLGGKKDDHVDKRYPHSKIFATEAERKKEGYCDGNISDLPAVLGQIKIGLVYHGNRNLTEENLINIRLN